MLLPASAWAASAPAVQTDGCRAVWLPNVSHVTFSGDLCSLSLDGGK